MTDTDNLPPVWALDMAAKAAGAAAWVNEDGRIFAKEVIQPSIIAHARTLETLREALRLLRRYQQYADGSPPDEVTLFLAKHEPELVPVDPDREDLIAIIAAWHNGELDADFIARNNDLEHALAEYKRRKANA